jgi:hypothetical protein
MLYYGTIFNLIEKYFTYIFQTIHNVVMVYLFILSVLINQHSCDLTDMRFRKR